MADFSYPPLDPGPTPPPLSANVALNPPMVGQASPFLRVDGQNRDLILESIRAWARTELLVWAKNWQGSLDEWNGATTDWINGWVAKITAGITAEYGEVLEIIPVAQAARDGAIAAYNSAVTARTGAETARTGAQTAQTAAETARTGAQTAQTGAETARTGAEAAKAAADAIAAGMNLAFLKSLVAGKPLTVYAHSFGESPAAFVAAGQDYPSLLAAEWGFSKNFKGKSGARMLEIAVMAIGQLPGGIVGDRHFVSPTAGPIIVHGQINDALFGPATAAGRLGFEHGLRALLASVTAERRIESNDTSVANTGTWTSFALGIESGGEVQYSATPGAIKTFSNVVAPSGRVWVTSLAQESGTAVGVLSVKVDGVDKNNFNGNGKMQSFASTVEGVGTFPPYSPAAFPVDVPKDRPFTLTVHHTSTPTVYFDTLLIPPPISAPVIVVLDAPPGQFASAGNQAAWAANAPALQAIIESVASEFPSTSLVYLSTGWTPATMVASADGAGIHPNAVGHQYIATRISAALKTAIQKWYADKAWRP